MIQFLTDLLVGFLFILALVVVIGLFCAPYLLATYTCDRDWLNAYYLTVIPVLWFFGYVGRRF